MSYRLDLPILPISEVLEKIQHSLTKGNDAIIEAPPGAGKTTLVPLSLLNEHWLQGKRILMLEPRRMAARAAAQRMAALLGEKAGETVGYRVRQESKVSAKTRIEVITEGILNRLLLDDPELSEVALLIFDEFHERSLDADLGLALALQGRALFREADNPLKIVLMSATLNGEALSQLLPQAPVIRSEGRMFPVEVVYGQPFRFDDDIVERTTQTVQQALATDSGSLLVFLPGQREIQRTAERLQQRVAESILVQPLYGALSMQEQQQAIEPAPEGQRKVVLATDIAETSLTIEGISVVIDSGLCRQPAFDLRSGMTRLQTRRISQDSSVQRSGRAGRLSAGRCYRLWSEEQQRQLAPFRSPEILQADLAPLLLQLLAWGIDAINELSWLDSPTPAAIRQALDLLQQLGAIKPQQDSPPHTEPQQLSDWRLTSHGQAMSQLPTHPRLAHMLLTGAQLQLTQQACALAALLAERHPFARQMGADLSYPFELILGEARCEKAHRGWLQRSQQQTRQFARLLDTIKPAQPEPTSLDSRSALGLLIACAYPERIARRSGSSHEYRLANGQKARLHAQDHLVRSDWLAIAEVGGGNAAGQQQSTLSIFSAAEFTAEHLTDYLSDLTHTVDHLDWDANSERFVAEKRLMLGKLIIRATPISNPPAAAISDAIVQQIQLRGLDLLPWTPQARQWQARVQLLHNLDEDNSSWPDVSDQALLAKIDEWLTPFLTPVKKLSDLQQLDLVSLLTSLLPWPLPQQLDELCPTTITVPSGSQLRIDYCQQPPVLRVKLQEMFGCTKTPRVANGRVALMLHLLSPAQRPLQVTQNLAAFWQGSYFEVQKEMKGRYPKHPWPDNPLQAQATRYTKKKLT